MNAEQQGLFENACASLEAARATVEKGLYDDTASRAYYAMFHLARLFLLEHGLIFSKHRSVLAAFGQHFAKTGLIPAHFHRYLLDAQDKRLTGDYNAMLRVPRAEALRLIQQAEELLQLTEERYPRPAAAPTPPTQPTDPAA